MAHIRGRKIEGKRFFGRVRKREKMLERERRVLDFLLEDQEAKLC